MNVSRKATPGNDMHSRGSKRGQIVVYDFIIGFTAFMVVITFTSVLWYNAYIRSSLDDEQASRFALAHNLATQLVSTTGYPEHWEYDPSCVTIQRNCTIGLASSPLQLSDDKLDALWYMNRSLSIGYYDLKDALNVGQYNFSVVLRRGSTTVYSVGVPGAGNLTATVARKIMYNDAVHTLEVSIH